MWLGRSPFVKDQLYMYDGTFSYIRFWNGKALSSGEVQQLNKMKDEIHTASPTVTNSPSAIPTTASPTATHAPTINDVITFAPTSRPQNVSMHKYFVTSNFEQLQEAIALLTDNAIIEINASIAITETLFLSGGYTNVTIRSTPGKRYTLVSEVLGLFVNFARQLILHL